MELKDQTQTHFERSIHRSVHKYGPFWRFLVRATTWKGRSCAIVASWTTGRALQQSLTSCHLIGVNKARRRSENGLVIVLLVIAFAALAHGDLTAAVAAVVGIPLVSPVRRRPSVHQACFAYFHRH